MKLFQVAKDGGPESHVTGYWLIEIKWLFSIVLLRFLDGSRDAYHTHAFNSWNWVLRGCVCEILKGTVHGRYIYKPSWRPIFTSRARFHKVVSIGTTWVFSLRGPWSKTWQEYIPATKVLRTLTHGRVER